MRAPTILLAVAVFAASAVAAFLVRYEAIAVSGSSEDRGTLYRFDRWTGDVAVVNGKNFLLLKAEPVDTVDIKLPDEALPSQDGVLSMAPGGQGFSFSTFNTSPYTITSLTLSITYTTDIGKITRLFRISPSYGNFSPMTQSNETTFKFPHDFKGGATWKVVEARGYIL